MWPSLSAGAVVDLPELKALPALVAEDAPLVPAVNFERYSKLLTLQRVYSARVYRFIHNCKNPTNRSMGTLQVHELEKLLNTLIKIAQTESFKEEINNLQASK